MCSKAADHFPNDFAQPQLDALKESLTTLRGVLAGLEHVRSNIFVDAAERSRLASLVTTQDEVLGSEDSLEGSDDVIISAGQQYFDLTERIRQIIRLVGLSHAAVCRASRSSANDADQAHLMGYAEDLDFTEDSLAQILSEIKELVNIDTADDDGNRISHQVK